MVDTGVDEAFGAVVVGSTAPHHADVADLRLQRCGDGGDVELGVVGEDADGVARAEITADVGKQPIGPIDDEIVSHREALVGGEHFTGIAHRHPIAEHLGDLGERSGEIDGTEDQHLRRRSE